MVFKNVKKISKYLKNLKNSFKFKNNYSVIKGGVLCRKKELILKMFYLLL